MKITMYYLAALALAFAALYWHRHRGVEVGQVWTYQIGEKDPFRTWSIETNTVLAVKSGYVQFRKERAPYLTITNSERVSWFRAGSTRIK